MKLRSLGAFGSNICRNRFAVCDTEVAGPLKERGLSESHGQRHEQQQFLSQMDRRKFPTETRRNVQHEDP